MRVAATGSEAELVATLPITREPGAARAVAMRLGPGDTPHTTLPGLAGGDLLRVMAEVEVTTDSGGPLGRVGRAYDFAPRVEANLMLAADPEATAIRDGRALSLAAPCRVEIDHLGHHRTIVFPDAGVRIPAGGLPWPAGPWVTLVLGAHHPDAEEGQVLLVGENEPGGRVRGGKGRLSALRVPAEWRRSPEVGRETAQRSGAIPVRKGERTVVYSLRIAGGRAREQLAIRARMLTSAERLGYPAPVSSRQNLADDPGQTQPGGRVRDIAALRGAVSPFNGFNCVPGRGACATEKAGVAALRGAPPSDLFVNLVAVGADPFGGARRGDALEVMSGGFVEASRYPP